MKDKHKLLHLMQCPLRFPCLLSLRRCLQPCPPPSQACLLRPGDSLLPQTICLPSQPQALPQACSPRLPPTCLRFPPSTRPLPRPHTCPRCLPTTSHQCPPTTNHQCLPTTNRQCLTTTSPPASKEQLGQPRWASIPSLPGQLAWLHCFVLIQILWMFVGLISSLECQPNKAASFDPFQWPPLIELPTKSGKFLSRK